MSEPAKRFPDAPCHGCKSFRGFSSIISPDFDPGASARCIKLQPVPLTVLEGGKCDQLEAGEHPEYT